MPHVIDRLIEERVRNLYGTDFQNFIDQLYILRYGTDFDPVKDKRDQGCDGILTSKQAVLAVYGPEDRNLRSFKRKVGQDFEKYRDHWESYYPNWQLVYNKVLTAQEIQFLDSLKPNTEKVGLKHILGITQQLAWTDMRRVASHLGIDEQFVYRDTLLTVLEDLLRDDSLSQDAPSHTKAVYIEDKIELNYSIDEVQAAKDEYRECLEYFGTLKGLLAGYADREISALKSRIRRDYGRVRGPFSERLEYMVEHYSDRYARDDLYVFNVRVVLLFFFEQCLIGKKTRTESL